MKIYTDALDQLSDTVTEAGNISSSIAIRKQDSVIRRGKDAISIRLRDRDLDKKLNSIAKQNADLAGLILMSIGVSGDDSFMSRVAQGISLRSL